MHADSVRSRGSIPASATQTERKVEVLVVAEDVLVEPAGLFPR